MKKKIVSIFVIAVAVVAGWNFNQSKSDVELSDLTLANVEALASNEEVAASGRECYNSITTKELSQIFYCGTCSFVNGTNSTFSGKGKC